MTHFLDIKQLNIEFRTHVQTIQAVRNFNFSLNRGESVAIVGESGAGKSQIFHALMGLLPPNARVTGEVKFQGNELLNMPTHMMNRFRGKRISMVFQDPMTSLNPFLTIGRQLTEVLAQHLGMSLRQSKRKAIDMLERVRINKPEQRFKQYPHELSGGMRQRVMIAMALLCDPGILIADEPTTALDATVQSDILKLFADIQAVHQTSIILITHDLPIVSSLCQRIHVMYAGQCVESGTIRRIFKSPAHPYTQALLASMPQQNEMTLNSLKGQPPDASELDELCAFRHRCDAILSSCKKIPPTPALFGNGRSVLCHQVSVHE